MASVGQAPGWGNAAAKGDNVSPLGVGEAVGRGTAVALAAGTAIWAKATAAGVGVAPAVYGQLLADDTPETAFIDDKLNVLWIDDLGNFTDSVATITGTATGSGTGSAPGVGASANSGVGEADGTGAANGVTSILVKYGWFDEWDKKKYPRRRIPVEQLYEILKAQGSPWAAELAPDPVPTPVVVVEEPAEEVSEAEHAPDPIELQARAEAARLRAEEEQFAREDAEDMEAINAFLRTIYHDA